jgi:hypothetical protein
MPPTDFRETIFYRVLEVLGKLLVPATFVSLLANAVGLRPQQTAILAVTVFSLAAVALFRQHFPSWRSSYILFLVGVFIGLTAAYSWTTFQRDPWWVWESRLQKTVDDCQDGPCVAKAITLPHPQADRHHRDQLAADLRAGVTIMHIPKVAERLDQYLGIKDTFLGTGITQPLGSNDYGGARIAEFLVPNVTDKLPKVLTWRLSPVAMNLSRSLSSVVTLEGTNPTRPNIDEWRKIITDRLDIDDQLPAVVRVSQFPEAQYSGRLGRNEAARVFTLHLGQVWDMSLEDVAQFSGYTLRPSAGNDVGTLFVWIFVPEHPDEVTPATWKNILARAPLWID